LFILFTSLRAFHDGIITASRLSALYPSMLRELLGRDVQGLERMLPVLQHHFQQAITAAGLKFLDLRRR
jgi:hypothetical protein